MIGVINVGFFGLCFELSQESFDLGKPRKVRCKSGFLVLCVSYRIVSCHRVLWMAVVDVLIVQKRNLSSESAGFN